MLTFAFKSLNQLLLTIRIKLFFYY